MIKNKSMKMQHPFFDKEIISGKKLYGDDFTFEMIKEWYNKESKSYEEQFNKSLEINNYVYQYHSLNKILGFSKIPKQVKFKNILSFGGGFGCEIESLISKAENIYIIEPSKTFRRYNILDKSIQYLDPSINGKIEFPDGFFDVITCFGVLMYIPNVSFVLSELNRCLKKNGYLMIREPISDSGIGLSYRKGCGENTRGIPLNYFKNWVAESHFSEAPITPHNLGPLIKVLNRLHISTYNNNFMTKLDIFLCILFKFNYKYYRKNIWRKFAPGAVFLMLKK